MSKFREFQISAGSDLRGGPLAERAAAVNARLATFSHALDWYLWIERPNAPFQKLAVKLVDPPRATWGFKFGSIANCDVAADLPAIARAEPAAVRQIVAALTLQALDWASSTYVWSNPALVERVGTMAKHKGPYRVEWPKLSIRDRRTGGRFTTAVDVSDDWTRVVVRRDENHGRGAIERVVAEAPRPAAVDWFDARAMQLIGDWIVFLDKQKTPIGKTNLVDFHNPAGDIPAR
jgi:hypothetical protein